MKKTKTEDKMTVLLACERTSSFEIMWVESNKHNSGLYEEFSSMSIKHHKYVREEQALPHPLAPERGMKSWARVELKWL